MSKKRKLSFDSEVKKLAKKWKRDVRQLALRLHKQSPKAWASTISGIEGLIWEAVENYGRQ